ncbi:MAG: RIP metalloprotease RseP [Gemmatimonadales bacterium]
MNPVLVNVLAFIVVLGVLIFVHELGHFLAAKWAGIWVHRFSIGMGKPIRALTRKWGETEYVISWLPIGGYVKMASREEDPVAGTLEGGPASDPVPPHRVFEAKPVWVRMIVILAGVTMNGLFAWLVFAGLFYGQGQSVIPITRVGAVAADLPPGAEELRRLEPGDRIVAAAGQPVDNWEAIGHAILTTAADSFSIEVEGKPPVTIRIHRDALEARLRASNALSVFLPPVIGQVVPGGPGDRAGMKVGDTLIAIGGQPIRQWTEAFEAIEARPDQPVDLVVGRPDGRTGLTAQTTSDAAPDTAGRSRRVGKLRVGVQVPERHLPVSLARSIGLGGRQTLGVTTQIIRTVRGMFTGRVSTRELGGPIAIGVMAGQSAQQGLVPFLGFMAMISSMLAVLNLLPIPVLDGGQFVFLVAEAILRRPLSVKLRERLTLVGLVLIGLLMVLAFSNDIRRLIGV